MLSEKVFLRFQVKIAYLLQKAFNIDYIVYRNHLMKNTLFLLILLPLLAFGQEAERLKTDGSLSRNEKALEYPDTITELDFSGCGLSYLPPK